ncbi:MAG TPA: hypothetical protein VK640_04110 [Actinomycetes bacterium]|nr:hypothetical protein [Actinomycetes bacterium]
MARQEKAPRQRTTTSDGPFWEFLQDLRQIWSVNPGTSQPTLRDYPLRRPGGGAR